MAYICVYVDFIARIMAEISRNTSLSCEYRLYRYNQVIRDTHQVFRLRLHPFRRSIKLILNTPIESQTSTKGDSLGAICFNLLIKRLPAVLYWRIIRRNVHADIRPILADTISKLKTPCRL